MTTKQRRKNEIIDALSIAQKQIVVLALRMQAMPTNTGAELRRLTETVDAMRILLTRSDELTAKLNALSDTE